MTSESSDLNTKHRRRILTTLWAGRCINTRDRTEQKRHRFFVVLYCTCSDAHVTNTLCTCAVLAIITHDVFNLSLICTVDVYIHVYKLIPRSTCIDSIHVQNLLQFMCDAFNYSLICTEKVSLQVNA